MQLTVKTLSGRQQNFSFDKTTLVSEVKHALQEKEGIQVDQVRKLLLACGAPKWDSCL